MLNFIRFTGDMAHLGSIFLLITRLRVTKSAVGEAERSAGGRKGNDSAIGISLKTQELFLIVFVTRYLDLFYKFYSIYNSVMKVHSV